MLPPKVPGRFDARVEKVVTLHADESPWQTSIIDLIPDFVRRAEEVFGKNLPHVNFYFFRTHNEFAANYMDVTGAEMPDHLWHDGTGGLGFVAFSETNRKNETARGPGDVMHEYGHALCNTIYGARYLHDVPAWFNEGVADYIARPWYEDIYRDARKLIQTESDAGRLPSFQVLSNNFYKLHHAAYPLGRLMVMEMMAGQSPHMIATILQEAKERGGAFAEVIQGVASVSPRKLYEKVLATNAVGK